MLSLFPSLLSYNLLVPFVFRVIIGLLFVSYGYSNMTKNKERKLAIFNHYNFTSGKVWVYALSLVEIVSGIFLIAGLYTQAAALIIAVLLVLGIIVKGKIPETIATSKGTLYLLLLITTSLLFLGAGLWSVDLPL